MKNPITNKCLLSELCKTRKDISQLKLLLETAVGNQHKIMRIIDPLRKIEVQDREKTFEEIWGLEPKKEEEQAKLLIKMHNEMLNSILKSIK
jgi:hypothetical protein